MNPHTGLPSGLDIKKASFYAEGSSVNDVARGTREDLDYVTFVYDPNSECSQAQTVVALKADSPKIPTTSLSAASGVQLERLGQWVLAFEPGREVTHERMDTFVVDVLKLLEYAKEFPQNV